jgi:hypothetical protein
MSVESEGDAYGASILVDYQDSLDKIRELGGEIGINSAVAVKANWTFRTRADDHVYTYQFSVDGIGDILYFNRDWILIGESNAYNRNTGKRWADRYELEYKAADDSLTWKSWGRVHTFNLVSAPQSIVDIKVDPASRSLLVRVKADTKFEKIWMYPSAFVLANS